MPLVSLLSRRATLPLCVAASIAITLFLFPLPAKAADAFGPEIGTHAPSIGTPVDQNGVPRDLASLMGSNGLVLLFFRSADWCPFCQVQLIELNDGLADFESRGYNLAGISYDSPEILETLTERRDIAYPLLSDPDSEIIDRFGLRDPQYPPGHRAHGVPRPIILVLDANGTVTAKLYEETHRTRPPVALVVTTLDALAEE